MGAARNDVGKILMGVWKGKTETVLDSTPKLTRVEISAFNRQVRATVPTEHLTVTPRS